MVGVLFECAEVKLQLLASTKPRVAFCGIQLFCIVPVGNRSNAASRLL